MHKKDQAVPNADPVQFAAALTRSATHLFIERSFSLPHARFVLVDLGPIFSVFRRTIMTLGIMARLIEAPSAKRPAWAERSL